MKTTATTNNKDNKEIDMFNRVTHKTVPSEVKNGELMAFTYYVKVKFTTPNKLEVTDVDRNNLPITITGQELIESALSADQFQETIKVGKTQAAEILVSSTNRPFTVSFIKADGTERILRGRLVRPEPLLGRSMVEDLDLESNNPNRLRQVDHRTIEWIVVEGTKYEVK